MTQKPLRAILYYRSVGSVPYYGHTPSPHLDPHRLMAGRPAFKHGESWIEKKKTLVIANRCLFTSKANTDVIIKERLEALARQGFEVYVFFKGALHPWDEVKGEKFFDRGDVSTVSPEALASLNRSADELLVIDEDLVMRLIEGDDGDWVDYAAPSVHRLDLSCSNLSATSLSKLLALKHGEGTSQHLISQLA